MLRIANACDVVVESFRPGVAEKMGLGFDDISAVRLDVIYCVFSSGAAHTPQMWHRIGEVFGVDELFTAYGQTETTASTVCTLPGDPLTRLQTTNGTIEPAGVAGDPTLGGGLAVYKVVAPDTGEELAAGQLGEGNQTPPTQTLELT